MIELECVTRTDPRYKSIRDRHYIPNSGCHGQQLHYLAFDEGQQVGIISGASATYDVGPRDRFFGLSKSKAVKQVQLNGIISNNVFRLEVPAPNRATRILSAWRKRIAWDWEYLYGVKVAGFETFIIEERRDGQSDRLGTLYLADNWTFLGVTKGNTKQHAQEKGSGGLNAKHTRKTVVPKLIYAIKVKKARLPESYESSWKGNPGLARERSNKRKSMIGQRRSTPADLSN